MQRTNSGGFEEAKKVMRRTLDMLEPKRPSTLDMFHVVFKTATGYGASQVFNDENEAKAHAEVAYRLDQQARVMRVLQFRCPVSGEWLP